LRWRRLAGNDSAGKRQLLELQFIVKLFQQFVLRRWLKLF